MTDDTDLDAIDKRLAIRLVRMEAKLTTALEVAVTQTTCIRLLLRRLDAADAKIATLEGFANFVDSLIDDGPDDDGPDDEAEEPSAVAGDDSVVN